MLPFVTPRPPNSCTARSMICWATATMSWTVGGGMSAKARLPLMRNAGGEATFAFGDVSKEASVKAMIDTVVETYGRLDIACNSAALSRGSGPIHEYTREVFDQTLEMCLTNTWLCMKYEIPAMLEAGGSFRLWYDAGLKGGLPAEGHHAGLAALAGDLQKAVTAVNIGFIQGRQLRQAQARGIEQHQRPVLASGDRRLARAVGGDDHDP